MTINKASVLLQGQINKCGDPVQKNLWGLLTGTK